MIICGNWRRHVRGLMTTSAISNDVIMTTSRVMISSRHHPYTYNSGMTGRIFIKFGMEVTPLEDALN
jgi:hypothetical protein